MKASMTTGLVSKYEARRSGRFVVSCDGINSLLVKSITRPDIVRSETGWVYKPIELVVSETIGAETTVMIEKALEEWNFHHRHIVVKFIDEFGIVYEQLKYYDTKLVGVKYSTLSYDSMDPTLATLFFEYSRYGFFDPDPKDV